MSDSSSTAYAQPFNPLDAAIGMRLAYWAYEHKDIQQAEKVAKYPDAWRHAKPGDGIPAEWPAARQDAEGTLLPGSPDGWNTQHNASGKLENQFKVSINTETQQISIDFKGSDALSNWKSDLGNAGASDFAKIEAKAQAALEALQSNPDFKSYSFAATGHSLGGGMAQSFALKNNIDAYVYNSLPIARDTIKGDYFQDVGGFDAALERYKASGRQVQDVRTPNDIATYTYDHVMRNQYLSDHVGPGATMLPGPSLPPWLKTVTVLSGSGTLVAGTLMGLDHPGKALIDAQHGLSVGADGRYRIPEGHADFARVPPEARKLFAELSASPVTKTLCTEVGDNDLLFDRFHVQHEDGSQERIAINPRTGDMEIDHYDKNGHRTLIEMHSWKDQPARVTEFDAHNRPMASKQVAMSEPATAMDNKPTTQVAAAAAEPVTEKNPPAPALTPEQKKQFLLAVRQTDADLQSHGLSPEQVVQVCAAGVAHCARVDKGAPERFVVSRDGERLGVLHEGQVLSEMAIAPALEKGAQAHLADAAQTEQVQQERRQAAVASREVALPALA
jgi:hypothetical protein